MNKRKNHFRLQEERNGKDFLENQTPNQIKQFHAPRIISDIARGNIDYRTEERYLSNRALLSGIMDISMQKYISFDISARGVELLLNQLRNNNPNDPMINTVTTVHNIHYKSAELYRLVLEAFRKYMDTGDIDYLYPLGHQLRGYSDYI